MLLEFFAAQVDRLSKMSFLLFPKNVCSNTFIYVYLRSLEKRKIEDPLLRTFLVFTSGNLNLIILSRFFEHVLSQSTCRAVYRDILGKIFFCSFGTPVFLLMLRNNLIYIEFFVSAYHFKLVTIVWTLLTRLGKKFLENRWDLFLTLEEFRIC